MNQIGTRLIKALGLDALPTEEQAAVVEKFGDVLFRAVLARGLSSLTEEQKDALDAALGKNKDNSPDVFMDFFMANVPNFQVMVDEEAKRIYDRAVRVAESK
jgi:hypothetical protein